MNDATKMKSRIYAVAVAATFVILAASVIVLPLLNEYSELGKSISEQRLLFARYRQLAANHDDLRDQLVSIQRQAHSQAHYVTGDTPALASANMQRHLKQLIDSIGGELISTQLLGGDEDDLYASAALQIRMRADLETMMKLLYRLENGKPMFFLNELSINARPLRRAAQAADSAAGILDVHFTMTGYLPEAT